MCHIAIMGFKRKVRPQKGPSAQQGDEAYANAREMRSLQALTKIQKMSPKPSRSHTLEIPLYLADPAAQQRKQKASRTEEQIKEHLLKRSIYQKEKRKNFTDEERKRASAMTMENRRKHKARWTSEERAENRMKEAAAEKNRRDS
jgi:hypothetical protein